MIKLLTATFVTVVLVSTSSACWFPFFPNYCAGYSGWGIPAPAFAYAPSYGYGYPNHYGTAAYSSPYAVSYGGFSTSAGCNTCGQASCCGTCGNSCNSVGNVGFANYGVGCASGCGSVDCVPSGVVTKPIPDPVGGGAADERDLPKTYEPPSKWPDDRKGGVDPDPTGDFRSRGGADQTREDDYDWMKRREEAPGSDLDGGLYKEDPIPPYNPRKPAIGDPMDGDADDGLINQSSNKPPISDPMKEEGTSDEAQPEDQDADFLAPEAPAETARRSSIFFASNREFRSSHFDVLRPQRTAGHETRRSPVTQISTSKKHEQSPRWISVPMPAGRERI